MRVHPNFWLGTSGQQLRGMGTDHLLLALYFLTNPHVNLYGLYYLPVATITAETGIKKNLHGIIDHIATTEFAYYRDSWIWVPRMLRFQMGDFSPADNRLKSAARWYAQLPSTCPFLSAFWAEYNGALPLGECRGTVEPAPAGNTVKDSSALVVVGAPAPTVDPQRLLFEHWWELYPKKHGKRAAWAEWLKLKPTGTQVEAWCDTLVRQTQSREWLKDGGQFIPDPERYLKRGKYEDILLDRPIVGERQTNNFSALADFAQRKLTDERRPPAGPVGRDDGEAGRRLRQDTGPTPVGHLLGTVVRREPVPAPRSRPEVDQGTDPLPPDRGSPRVLRPSEATAGTDPRAHHRR